MKVIATARGYYGGAIREAGEQFVIADDADFGSWMHPVDGVMPKGKGKDNRKPTKAELVANAVGKGVKVTPDTMNKDQIEDAIEAADAAADEGEIM